MENPQTGSSAPQQQQQQPASADNREEEPVQDTDQESRPEELAGAGTCVDGPEHQTDDLFPPEYSEPKGKKADNQPNLQVPVDQEVQQELRAELSYLGGKTSERSWWLITIGWNFVGLLRKLVNLQLFPVKIHSVVTGQTFGAESEILEQVKTIKSTHVQITTNYQNCDVIIVFCPIVSRAGSDVEAAMRQTPGRKPVILVLLHHTRDVDYSTDGKKWSEIYQNIVLDVDVLFHETQLGLLQCDRNKQAVQKIKKVLKEHSKWW